MSWIEHIQKEVGYRLYSMWRRRAERHYDMYGGSIPRHQNDFVSQFIEKKYILWREIQDEKLKRGEEHFQRESAA